ncbi:hypothetical protein M409DRAFT_49012 [Zasmidium cellare ATCC 36951]|uniref:Mitochondrial carrier n=1 Tax=Zasmidium cellare ATCC 36951 TaxID=1080233 RepID=A0A6A6D4T8_ZASCE|nr:uncharacterized protein M409DRAFT_49012 [Zasmidium cellare ATCC 36951]KAF2174143.1 hypothetical protein M409DRAFT_49012 [Zasmidium cellare ATCC 36951]
MSADFWSGYVSGAVGILVGNPLDIFKTKLQAGSIHSPPQTTTTTASQTSPHSRWTSFARGSAAPILGYGALNGLLFYTYNRSLSFLSPGDTPPNAAAIWTSGALGGLATFVVSAPTELVKCRAQVASPAKSSWEVTRDLWRKAGVRGLYLGGGVTSVRDAVGYGFYFWSYELTKRAWSNESDSQQQQALKVLLCGGLAGVVTWASIFPLDMMKTRVQTWDLMTPYHTPTPPLVSASASASQPLLQPQPQPSPAPPQQQAPQPSDGATTTTMKRPSTFAIANEAYRAEGAAVFFRGLGVCSARAFIVNAVQWAVYEWMMKTLTS